MHCKNNRKLLPTAIVAALIFTAAAIAAMPWINGLYDPALRDDFTAYTGSLGIWGYVLLFGLQVLQVVVAIIPGEPVELLAGAVCGGFGGLMLCLAGCALGSAAVFMFMRRLGRPVMEKLFSKRHREFSFLRDSRRLDTVVFILFLIPGTPKDILTYAVGTTRMPLGRFLIISLFARIPSVVSSTYIGDTVLGGNWYAAAGILAATLVTGLAGILLRERALEFCRRHSRRAAARDDT